MYADSNTSDLALRVLNEVVTRAAEAVCSVTCSAVGRLSVIEAEACGAGSSSASVAYQALGHAERLVLHDQPADCRPAGIYWTCMQH